MKEQLGWRGFRDRLMQEAPQFANFVPQIPRLVHRVLERQAEAPTSAAIATLVAAQQRTRRTLVVGMTCLATLLAGILAMLVVIVMRSGVPWF